MQVVILTIGGLSYQAANKASDKLKACHLATTVGTNQLFCLAKERKHSEKCTFGSYRTVTPLWYNTVQKLDYKVEAIRPSVL